MPPHPADRPYAPFLWLPTESIRTECGAGPGGRGAARGGAAPVRVSGSSAPASPVADSPSPFSTVGMSPVPSASGCTRAAAAGPRTASWALMSGSSAAFERSASLLSRMFSRIAAMAPAEMPDSKISVNQFGNWW